MTLFVDQTPPESRRVNRDETVPGRLDGPRGIPGFSKSLSGNIKRDYKVFGA